MRRALRFPLGPILFALLAVPQADARGGGGGGGGGFGGIVSGGFHAGSGFRGAIRLPGFARHRPFAPFAARRVLLRRQFAGFPDGFQNGANIFSGWWGSGVWNSFPARGGWGWPVGGWGWPLGDWWPEGYADQPVQQIEAPAPQPQVIVIHTDGQGRMTTTEAAPDYSYVKGCHAINNGYHCDVTTGTP